MEDVLIIWGPDQITLGTQYKHATTTKQANSPSLLTHLDLERAGNKF